MDKYQLKRYMDAEPGAKLRDLVTKLLYDEIVSLRILPGTKLNVNQLAASLGVSRTPVAEAVASLADVGFVVSHPGQSGSFVLDLNMVDMINLYHVRNAIESEAAYLCAHAADDSTVHELTLLAEAFKNSVSNRDIRGMRETDMPLPDPQLREYPAQAHHVPGLHDRVRGPEGQRIQPLALQREIQPRLRGLGHPHAYAGAGAAVHGRPYPDKPQLHQPLRRRGRPLPSLRKAEK